MKPLRGFTLIELMVTLAVATILLTVALPNFQTFIKRNALTARTNNFIADLHFARSEAAKRGGDVSVCPSSNGTTCDTSAANWKNGWSIIPTGQTAVRRSEALTGTLTIITENSKIVFKSSGITGVLESLTFCETSIKESRAVKINSAGHVSTTKGTCP
jgi:type IV fimbrial biogenesis protein FimT